MLFDYKVTHRSSHTTTTQSFRVGGMVNRDTTDVIYRHFVHELFRLDSGGAAFNNESVQLLLPDKSEDIYREPCTFLHNHEPHDSLTKRLSTLPDKLTSFLGIEGTTPKINHNGYTIEREHKYRLFNNRGSFSVVQYHISDYGTQQPGSTPKVKTGLRVYKKKIDPETLKADVEVEVGKEKLTTEKLIEIIERLEELRFLREPGHWTESIYR